MNVVRFGALQTLAGLLHLYIYIVYIVIRVKRGEELRWTALTFSLISFWTETAAVFWELSQVSSWCWRSWSSASASSHLPYVGNNVRQLNIAFCGKSCRTMLPLMTSWGGGWQAAGGRRPAAIHTDRQTEMETNRWRCPVFVYCMLSFCALPFALLCNFVVATVYAIVADVFVVGGVVAVVGGSPSQHVARLLLPLSLLAEMLTCFYIFIPGTYEKKGHIVFM